MPVTTVDASVTAVRVDGAVTSRVSRSAAVEDDPKTAQLVTLYLKRDGHRVTTVGDGEAALERARAESPELVILDVMLPKLDGLEVCSRLRRESDAFIIMLTARSTEEDTLAGLYKGADDYVVKPFSPRELAARVQAVLRRAPGRTRSSTARKLGYGPLAVDIDRFEATCNGVSLTLTPAEFRLLVQFVGEPGRTFSRAQLVESVFGHDYDGFERSIDVHIAKLRRKIESGANTSQLIETVYGYGYRFGKTEEQLK